MGDNTAIEWTDATWNPIRARRRDTGKIGWHCEHVSEGCRNCYAEAINRDRLGTRLAYKPWHRVNIDLYLDEEVLLQPLRWRRPRMIFPGSMTDLFADFVTDAMLDKIFAVMAASPHHTFQPLTKRASRMRAYLSDADRPRLVAREWCYVGRNLRDNHPGWSTRAWTAKGEASTPRSWPLPNVWLGTSCEDQATADTRIPDLLATPAAMRFVSAEPLLGPLHFGYLGWPGGQAPTKRTGHNALLGARYEDGRFVERIPKLDWIIVGGESGSNARPMHPQWARSIRDQCGVAGVAFLFKQWGAYRPIGAIHAGEDTVVDAIINCDERRSLILCGDGREWSDADGQPPGDAWMVERVGKKAAGRLLDGVEHDSKPASSTAPYKLEESARESVEATHG